MGGHLSGKEEGKYVKAEEMMLGFCIEREKRFLQVEGIRGKGRVLISQKKCIMEA